MAGERDQHFTLSNLGSQQLHLTFDGGRIVSDAGLLAVRALEKPLRVNVLARGYCRYLLEALAVVYHNDTLAGERQLTPEQRLRFHQEASQPTMQQLHEWLTRQLEEKLTEPNSALGGAISYMLRHWEKLTLFLRQAGAPLDNNVCERALKKAILHRKNALFYKTQNGARVGDLFMSLIYTCQLNDVNPLDYLTQLQRHADQVAANPELWMPWTYRVEVILGTQPGGWLREAGSD